MFQKTMESFPLDYNLSDLLFPSNYNNDINLDLFLHDIDDNDPILDHDIFMNLELEFDEEEEEEEEEEAQLIHSSISDPLAIKDSSSSSSLSSPQQAYNLLLMCAESIESDNWHLASTLLTKLDHLHLFNVDDVDSPFLQLARFFAQGLRLRATGPHHAKDSATTAVPNLPVAGPEDMSAYQMVQELSPFIKFVHFTANQAILEATQGDAEVHVIDFDVMEGIQWPPLMVDLATRNSATSLRITAVVVSSTTNTVHDQTGRRLVEFAGSIGFNLNFDQLELKDLDRLQVPNGSVIANYCMAHHHQPQTLTENILSKLSKLDLKMVVLVQEEIFRKWSSSSSSLSFVEFFGESLRHFASLAESLASSFNGGYKVGLRLVEREIVGPRIVGCVSGFGFGFAGGTFRMEEEGFKVVPVSGCNVAQAKYLLGAFNRGFGVECESSERLSLCWKSRPLVNVSIWVPT